MRNTILFCHSAKISLAQEHIPYFLGGFAFVGLPPPFAHFEHAFRVLFLTKYLSGNIPATLQGFFGSIILSNLHGMCVSKLALRAWALSNIAQWRWTHHWKLLYVDYQQNNYKSKANRSLAKPLNVRCSSYRWRRALPREESYGRTKWNPANLAQVSLLKPW